VSEDEEREDEELSDEGRVACEERSDEGRHAMLAMELRKRLG